MNASTDAGKQEEEKLTTFETISAYYVKRYGQAELNSLHEEILLLVIEANTGSGKGHYTRMVAKMEALWSHCQEFPREHELSEALFKTAFVSVSGSREALVQSWSMDKKTEDNYSIGELIELVKTQAKMQDDCDTLAYLKRNSKDRPTKGKRQRKRNRRITVPVDVGDESSTNEEEIAVVDKDCTCNKKDFQKHHRVDCGTMKNASEEVKAAAKAHFDMIAARGQKK